MRQPADLAVMFQPRIWTHYACDGEAGSLEKQAGAGGNDALAHTGYDTWVWPMLVTDMTPERSPRCSVPRWLPRSRDNLVELTSRYYDVLHLGEEDRGLPEGLMCGKNWRLIAHGSGRARWGGKKKCLTRRTTTYPTRVKEKRGLRAKPNLVLLSCDST